MLPFLFDSPGMNPRRADPTSIEEIARRLRITRKALGYTQAQMGQLAGASAPSQTWQNYEAGIRRISIDNALALCAATGLTLEWIYQGNMLMLPAEMAKQIQVQMRV